MKKTLALALTATLAVILSGCMRMHVNLTLEEDNKASGNMIFAISDEVAKQFDMAPEELFNSMLEQQGGESAMAPEGATATPYAQDGFTGTQWTFESKSLEDAATGQDLKIIRDGDDYVVSGELDMSDTGTDDELTAGMADSMDIEVSITFPGEVTEHNGDLDGKTVTWSPDAGEKLSIEARGGATAGGSSSVLTIVLIVLGVLIVAGILWAVLGRKTKNAGNNGPDYNYTPGGPTQPGPYNDPATTASFGTNAGLGTEPGSGALPGSAAGAAGAAVTGSVAGDASAYETPTQPQSPTESSAINSSQSPRATFNDALDAAHADATPTETAPAAPTAAPPTAPNADISNQNGYTQEVDEPLEVVEDTIEPPQRFPQPPVDPQNPENPQQ